MLTSSFKTWLCICLMTAFAASFSLNLQAQTAPAKQWDHSFGGNAGDNLQSMQQTSDLGYILGGSSASDISGDKTQASKGANDYWVVKLDANGNEIWDKTIGGNDVDLLYSLQQTSDGGYILGGRSNSVISGDKSQPGRGSYDYWVVKLDASGNKTWDKTLGGSGTEIFSWLQQTSDGGYILGGYTSSGISGDKTQNSYGGDDFWIVRLDANGNKLWDKTLGGNSLDQLHSLQQTSDGGYILGGSSVSGISGNKSQTSNGSHDYWVVKLDANGNKIWDKSIGGSGGDILSSLQQTPDAGYILGGWSDSGVGGDKSQACIGSFDYWVVKLDTNGNRIWDKTFGGSGRDEIRSLQQTADGGYILGGNSNSPVSGDKTEPFSGYYDYWVVKLDAGGNKLWNKTIGGSGRDELRSLLQTIDGAYILGGNSDSNISGDKSQASKGGNDYWVIKLGLSPTAIPESESAFAVSVFPNPNKGNFNLQLSGITVPTVEVTVTDLLGRFVLQQELKPASQQIPKELALPSVKGIYLLQLKAGDQIITRKIIVE